MENLISFVVIAGLTFLGYQGWKNGKRWARVTFILIIVALLVVAGLFAAYVHALGQANWSL